jgi:anti-anti-sigma factor
MAEPFEINIDRTRAAATIVRVRGRIDGRSAPELMKSGLDAHESGRPLVLNLAEVTFLSSAGIGVLMVLAEKFREDGGLRLAPVSEPVRAVLGLLNLDQFLAIDDSEDDAMTAPGS